MLRSAARPVVATSASVAALSMPVLATTAARSLSTVAAATSKGSNKSTRTARALGVGLGMSMALLGARLYTAQAAEKEQSKNGLDPKNFNKFRLREVKSYNHNTSIFVFDLASPQAKLDMPVASFVLTKTVIDGKDCIRPYTPIDAHETGVMQLIVKKYDNGNMSKHIHSLKPGDFLEIKGPLPKLPYTANMKKEIGMIAGGSGITPMLQVINEVVSNPADKTKVTLLFANVTESDILCRERLDELAAKYPKKLSVHYSLDKPPATGWKGHSGFVDDKVIEKLMPKPTNDSLVMVCGPPPMMEAISGGKNKDFTQGPIKGALAKLGYQQDHVFKF